jgi:hypothetical protein
MRGPDSRDSPGLWSDAAFDGVCYVPLATCAIALPGSCYKNGE